MAEVLGAEVLDSIIVFGFTAITITTATTATTNTISPKTAGMQRASTGLDFEQIEIKLLVFDIPTVKAPTLDSSRNAYSVAFSPTLSRGSPP